MTWTRIGDDWRDRPVMLGVSRSARLLLLELYVYANRHTTDGRVLETALPRLTDAADWPSLLEELAGAELIQHHPPDWVLDWSDQEPAERVNARKEYNAEKQKRYRDRKDRHERGDHTACDPRFCKGVTGNATGNVTGLVTDSRPVPSRRDRGQGAEDDSAGAASSRLRGLKCPHGVVNGITRGQCPDEECVNDWEKLQVCNGGGCGVKQLSGSGVSCEPGECAVVRFAEVAAVRSA